MPEALSIKKVDPRFPEWLNFDEFKKEGLNHIAKLSGDLWTDHNLHDPGVTILEVLIYALTDLGYRNRLDVKDLFAKAKNDPRKEDNFYTVAEILSCNPLTILDYRKLLIDIDGVRNAWLIPATEQEVKIYFNCNQGGRLTYTPPPKPQQVICVEKDEQGREITSKISLNENEIRLRGLYKVMLDIDPIRPQDQSSVACNDDSLSTGRVLAEVNKRLHMHRNLCEDFLDVRVLQDEQIGLCADIELEVDAVANETLANIYNELQKLISPQLTFYTLSQMIERGKSLEEIFLGRPLVEKSHGFIDVEELEKLEIPEELRASDFYQAIMRAEGVQAVRNLVLINLIDGTPQTTGAEWVLKLTANHRPVFAPEHSRIKFFKDVLQFQAQTEEIIRQFEQRLSDFSKAKLKATELDLAIPEGRHRGDLSDYISIQHEFPLAYGIGQGGLPESAGAKRKVQALQLKAYLTFFDQILADYLSQLSHLRDLFSWSIDHTNGRDTSKQKTYFSNSLHNIPQIEKLIRFFQAGVEGGDISQGEKLAISATTFDNQVERELAIQQLIGDFGQLEKELELVAEKVEEEDKYYFVFRNRRGNQTARLRGVKLYCTEQEALRAGEMLQFLGTLEDSYVDWNRPHDQQYGFNFIFSPIDYLTYLQSITENRSNYLQRRERFLNHLLARFGEEFAEYVLLMFALNEGKKDLEEIVEDKSRFLSQYADISRNRGRAFNYADQRQIWDTDNVSGLEKRVSGLMGLDDWRRRHLNNFQVMQRREEYLFQILDHRTNVLFISGQTYADWREAEKEYIDLIERLNMPDKVEFTLFDCPEESIYGFKILDTKNGKDLAIHPDTYHSPESRDEALQCITGLFSGILGINARTESTKEGFYFTLFDEEGAAALFKSKKAYSSEKEAMLAWHEFIQLARDINLYEDLDDPFTGRFSFAIGDLAVHPKYYHSETGRNAGRNRTHAYIVGKDLHYRIERTPAIYSWVLNDQEGNALLESAHRFKSSEQSVSAWYRMLDWFDAEVHLLAEEDGGLFRFFIIDPYQRRMAVSMDYQLEEKFAQARAIAAHLIEDFKKDRDPVAQVPKAFRYELQDENGSPLLRSIELYPDRIKAQKAFKKLSNQLAAHYGLIEKEEGFSRFFISFFNGKDQLVAKSAEPYAIREEAENALNDIQRLLSVSDPIFASYEVPNVYRYDILGRREDALLLTSYLCFETEEAAYNAYLEALEEGRLPGKYIRTGTATYFTFNLVNGAQQIIAVPPRRFANRTTREEAIEKTLNTIIQTRTRVSPQVYRGLYKAYIDDAVDDPALKGEKSFREEKDAICHLYELIESSSESVNYEKKRSEDGCRFSFVVNDDESVIASHPNYYLEETAKQVQKTIINYIQKNKYNFKVESLVGKWRYNIMWDACSGRCESVLIEFVEHDTKKQAEDALHKLIVLFESREPEIFFHPTFSEKEQYSFEVVAEDNPDLVVARHPYRYESEEARDKVLKDAVKYIEFFLFVRETKDFSPLPEARRRRLREEPVTGHVISALEVCGECHAPKPQENPDDENMQEQILQEKAYYSAFKVVKEEEFVAVHPRRYSCAPDCSAALEELIDEGVCQAYIWTEICRQGNLIIGSKIVEEEEEKKYYFKIIDKDNHRYELFRSARYYESREEALAAFETLWPQIIQSAASELNYQKEGLEELICLLDRPKGNILAVIPQTFETEHVRTEAINRRLDYARYHALVKESGQYYFRLGYKQGKYDWKSALSYTDPNEAVYAFEHFVELLRYEVNYVKTGSPSACIFEIKLVETLLTSKETYLDCYEGEEVPPKITDCPEAWTGAKTFLIHAHEDYACYPYIRYEDDCRYSFRIVDNLYRLARHTGRYHTVAERERMLDWLYAQIQCQTQKQTNVEAFFCKILGQTHFFMRDHKSTCENNAFCREVIVFKSDDTNNVDEDELCKSDSTIANALWKSYDYFESEETAGAGYLADFFTIIEHAREIDYYQLMQEEEGYVRIVLTTDEGRIIAVSPCRYKNETDWKAAILQRIMHARLYPFFKNEDGYGFQCYSLEDLPLQEEAEQTSDCPPKPLNQFGITISGQVVWESDRTYKTLEEVCCAFCEFTRLLARKPNYQRTEASICGPFGIELTRPQNILAEHPASYLRRSDMKKAMERAKACYNVEGFHLIEHILLRPKVGVAAETRILFLDREGYVKLLTNKVYADKDVAEGVRTKIVGEMERLLEPILSEGLTDLEIRRKWIRAAQSSKLLQPYNLIRQNISELLLKQNTSAGLDDVIKDLKRDIVVHAANEAVKSDCLAPSCPDCCHAVEIIADTEEEFCEGGYQPCSQKSNNSAEALEKSCYIPGADPYSFWASIVIPYWPKRFQNPNFRQFFQDTLRKEVPAHIGLRICWLDPKQMQTFESAYRNWLTAFSGQLECDLHNAHCRLVELLFDMKNVYPPGQLQESICKDDDSKSIIFLDKSQLA